MNRFKTIVLGLVVVATFGLAAVPAVSYAATPRQTACQAISGNTACTDTSGGPSVNSIVRTVVNVLSLVVGIVAVIMIIVAGLKYITSSGDSNNVTSAKNTLLYAIIGLVVVAVAQFIVKFVLGRVAK